MSTKDIFEVIIDFLRIIASWPIILFAILIIYRKKIGELLPEFASNLAKRVKKASFPGGTTLEFELKAAEAEALKDTIDEGIKELKDNPDKLVSFIKDQIGKVVTPVQIKQPDKKPFHGKSILWVDDNPSNNTYESKLFKRLGANITTSLSTSEALDKLKNNSFDLIISDIVRYESGARNPDAGYELLDETDKLKLNIPLIFYTGTVSKMNTQRSQSAFGAADVSKELSNLVFSALTG